MVERCLDDDCKGEAREVRILAKLNLNPQMLSPSLWKFKPNVENITKNLQPPPIGFLKLNFDGASKGNPGQAVIGGIFRNSQASAVRIYLFPIGFATNNDT